jgi:peroxiredoxin
MPLLKPGSNAPAFTLAGMDGRQHSFHEALARGPLLIAFFKVSCPTCQDTLPFIERMYQQFAAQGVQIWGISQDDARSSRIFAKEFEVTFPVLIDDHPYEVSDAYGIIHVPTIFLIRQNGQIELTTDGFDKKDILGIQQWFAKHFSTKPPALFLPTERVPEFKPG